MKCLACGHENDYRTRQRTKRACDRCGRRFVFEPRERDPVTDPAFQNAINSVSDGGRLAWLERHLYYEVARRVRRRRTWHRLTRRAPVSVDAATFESLLARWTAQYGPPPRRLAERVFAADARAGERASDTLDYGFERLVVADSDAIVDVLLANGFHGDHRCAVLSASRYPRWAYDLLLPRLRAAPPETIVVVHDADPRGCVLAAEVERNADWFGGVDGVRVVDAGLRPADARRFRGVLLPGRPPAIGHGMSVDESRWLARHALELTAVRPRALLSVLGRVVAGESTEAGAGGDGGAFAPVWGDGGDGDGGDDGVG
jgi:DNA-directed RNA polymerase subunit RPC12/RpoP